MLMPRAARAWQGPQCATTSTKARCSSNCALQLLLVGPSHLMESPKMKSTAPYKPLCRPMCELIGSPAGARPHVHNARHVCECTHARDRWPQSLCPLDSQQLLHKPGAFPAPASAVQLAERATACAPAACTVPPPAPTWRPGAQLPVLALEQQEGHRQAQEDGKLVGEDPAVGCVGQLARHLVPQRAACTSARHTCVRAWPSTLLSQADRTAHWQQHEAVPG